MNYNYHSLWNHNCFLHYIPLLFVARLLLFFFLIWVRKDIFIVTWGWWCWRAVFFFLFYFFLSIFSCTRSHCSGTAGQMSVYDVGLGLYLYLWVWGCLKIVTIRINEDLLCFHETNHNRPIPRNAQNNNNEMKHRPKHGK